MVSCGSRAAADAQSDRLSQGLSLVTAGFRAAAMRLKTFASGRGLVTLPPRRRSTNLETVLYHFSKRRHTATPARPAYFAADLSWTAVNMKFTLSPFLWHWKQLSRSTRSSSIPLARNA
jgi:hypothetical protein